ncbi:MULTISPECIES: PAS-domain containing protein [unclassified Neorhizobium]|uniref:PAS-domain containing protein n=1 Tax=unclassified Neorhizobium TaxID=2629175 RepID=UPI001FF6CEF9|nr:MULTISPECIES: PAS-domain containing protein [unclassified Neorhizobium]MCJ9668439.1 PAS-domain containing protein [Neorhizobium sp. SHOUNA12B]MCJ9744030.1 PAS-domain containing protein [Neorhizobium sp. SHOUNA12A]
MAIAQNTAHRRTTVLVIGADAAKLDLSQLPVENIEISVVSPCDTLENLQTVVEASHPHLILLDITFADLCGVQTCRSLKLSSGTSEIPVILVTPEGDIEGRIAGFEAGAVDCVSSMIDSRELGARVNAQLASSRGRKQILGHEQQLRIALASMSQGVCLFNADGTLALSNSRYAEVYGVDPALIHPGQSLEDILKLRNEVGAVPTMSTEEYLAWAEDTNAAGSSQVWVKELRSGKVIRGCHQRTADGGWVSTHEDVTEARLAERSLAQAHAQAEHAEQEARAAHARLLAAFEVVPEGLALFDEDDRFVMWNRRYEQLYADSGAPLVKGMGFEDRLRSGLQRGQYPEAIGREEEWLADRLARHAEPKSAHEQRLPGNRWVRIEERRVSGGGSVGIRVDITDLKMREASFRLLFEGNPLPMWVQDRESLQFLDVNQAALDHYGYDRDLFLSMTLLDILPPEDWERMRVAATAAEHGREANRSQRHRTARGAEIEVFIYSSQLAFDSRPASLIAAVDVTERKRAERALLQHRDDLEETVRSRTAEIARQAAELERMLDQERQVNELQRQFVSMASHEFRTPLSIIDGAAQRLVRRKNAVTPEFIGEKTEQIRGAVSRMLELMESILAVGRLDHGYIDIVRKPCALADIIRTCSARQESIRKSHRFLLDLERLPSTIYGDSAALEQVFTNLFSNAVKYAPDSPNVYVTGWQQSDCVQITVRDEGIGIDADDLPKMFGRYFRARSSSGIAGTGIGLNLVKQVVQLHGGEIHVDSVKGEGTVFTVNLPIARPEQMEADTAGTIDRTNLPIEAQA